jgi:hypothetical protein
LGIKDGLRGWLLIIIRPYLLFMGIGKEERVLENKFHQVREPT